MQKTICSSFSIVKTSYNHPSMKLAMVLSKKSKCHFHSRQDGIIIKTKYTSKFHYVSHTSNGIHPALQRSTAISSTKV
ncbi:hypothetical protein OIU74_003722 [Salix koriyanagi]|uniref:Uncharacterized protein n=1 Tax=Salix koriyanagi TaxID=2511006 RepID=A0A9Q0V047_9ROSI|nr:hypothetical protein OIU74_003722 [Salix koriyanagi]